MKRITLDIDGIYNNETANRLSSALNELEGIMAAGVLVTEQKAIIYADDLLSENDLKNAANLLGFGASLLTEDYVLYQ